MDRESASPEDLPALELRKLRDLDVEEPSDAGRPAHLSAASGVVRRATYVYVIGDDELHLGVFDISSDRPGHLQRVLQGELPDGHAERSKEKPDLEALTLLPPFEGNPYGALLGLGSGSGPRRDRGFVCALGLTAGWPASRARSASSPSTRCYASTLPSSTSRARRRWGPPLAAAARNSEVGSNLVAELARRGDALAA